MMTEAEVKSGTGAGGGEEPMYTENIRKNASNKENRKSELKLKS